MPTLTTVITAGLAGLLAVPLLAFSSTGGTGMSCLPAAAISPPASTPALSGTSGTAHPVTTGTAATNTAAIDPVWDGEQTSNAALIVTIGQARGVPAWGRVVAVATAMQESRLRNLPGGDRNSIGLFQQRPSQGWGTPTQLRSPAYQTGKFYDALLAVPGWQTMPAAQAADHVQHSAYPSAYARWTGPATRLLAHIGSGNSRAIPVELEQFVSTPGCPLGGVGCAGSTDPSKDLEHSTGQQRSLRPGTQRLLTNSRNPSAHQPPDATPLVLTTAHEFPEPTAQLTPPNASLVSASAGNDIGIPGQGCLPGQQVLARAATWLTAWHGGPIPYSMSTNPGDWFGGYRRDCSGYASMALGLPGPGLDTAGLAAGATPIPKADLAPGDLLINPAPGGDGHVVVFERWLDASQTSYLGYEQSGDGGTHHRNIPYPYFGSYPMSPYRCDCAR